MRVVVYDRTSGGEEEGQDAAAQLAQTVHRAREAGHEVVGEFYDEDVSGDTPWEDRKGLRDARALADRAPRSALLVREVSRLWRGDPLDGLACLGGLADLVVLDAPAYARRDFAWEDDSDASYLVRFIGLWSSWAEKRRAETRSLLAMREIKAGRRKTETGKRPGRPSAVEKLSPEDLAWAREELAEGKSLLRVHRDLLVRRRAEGPNAFVDREAKKRAFVSYDTLARALGIRKPSAKLDPPQNSESPSATDLVRNEPVVRNDSEGSS